ncbi:MAG: hypothetical protein KME13_12970 [Myxacorys californica WJT36-NPBG1]|jgi:hypothetical protein|nr:hypothetical protein [Myxacorys californica WJT36-NPBG1]
MREKLLLAIVVTLSLSWLQQLSTPTARISPQIEQARDSIASFIASNTSDNNTTPSSYP